MPAQRHWHQPLIQEEQPKPEPAPEAPMEIRGMVTDGHLYLMHQDVVGLIRYLSSEAMDTEAALALMNAANILQKCGEAPKEQPVEPELGGTHPSERIIDVQPTDTTGVARVEVFPDPEGKWYARSVSDTGDILELSDGSFDREYVVRAAAEYWPGVEIHEVQDASIDSIWEQEHAAFGFNGRRRPSPKRLWSG